MPLRLLADHCVAGSVIKILRDAGHEVFRLGDYVPVESPDSKVIACAQELDAILLTLNGDFADIVAYPPSRYGGIVALQVRNHPELMPALTARLAAYLSAHPDREHHRAKLVIVEAARVRVRA